MMLALPISCQTAGNKLFPCPSNECESPGEISFWTIQIKHSVPRETGVLHMGVAEKNMMNLCQKSFLVLKANIDTVKSRIEQKCLTHSADVAPPRN